MASIDPNIMAAFGVIVAVIIKALWAWYNVQMAAGVKVTFGKKYVVTALMAIFGAIPLVQQIIATLAISPDSGLFAAFWVGFITGGGLKWFLDEIADKGTNPATPPSSP